MFVLLKYLHVLTMFAAVAVVALPGVVLHVVGRRGDVAGLRGFLPVAAVAGRLIAPLFVLGVLFGLAAAVAGQFDLLRPWLIASYVVFAVAMATGALLSGPWAQRVAAAAFASPTEAPSGDLQAAVHDRRGVTASAIMASAIVVVIFLMVAKPGG